MDIGTLLSVVQTLLTALQCTQLTDVWSVWGFKSHLDELIGVVATIKKVLLDAEAKYEELSQETLLYVQELRDAVYDADDLLDEFVTLTKQKQLMEDDKFTKKVRLFFSRHNQIGVAYSMSHGVKKIMKKLDGIASKHSKFGLSLDHKPIMRRREETCSYPDTEIIGRAEDLEKILEMLLNSDIERDVLSLTIVGMGGLGKTALAQLVYNHEKIAQEFTLRLWTCVSDHDQSKLDVKTVLAQIVESATGQKYYGYSTEVVVNRLREVLAQRRFLIVLDDLWTESRDEWRKLVGHLVGGKGGSRVLVTTRSKETAKIVGNGRTYELKGLSDENSWRLFQMMAFEQVLDQVSPNHYDDFINIGKNIVELCVNVPLAIRVIGSLLYGQDKSKWLSVQELGLGNLREDQNGIKPILKLSYQNLQSPLKSCFSYCSLFPKYFMIKKNLLIPLWIAQGYIMPLEKGQSLEDASEEYFLILLRRNFFQDVLIDEYGEVFSFKLHDLMHDLALEVAEMEVCPASSFTGEVDKVVRHVSFARKQYASYCFTKAHIRTYLQVCNIRTNNDYGEVLINRVPVLENYRFLRTLDLSFLDIKSLPDSLGKLIHLRYLDLSGNDMEVLPKSITELYNLQTLNLDDCWSLKELPKDMSKLVNLRVFTLSYCTGLWSMPPGMGKLVNLWRLSKFVVGGGNSSQKQHIELEGLKALKKLKGCIDIDIHFPESGAFVKDYSLRDKAYIRDKEHLKSIRFEFMHEEISDVAIGYEEELLGALQPHANLMELALVKYRGARMPRWAKEDNLATFLPNLIRLELDNCPGIHCFPSVGKLYYLKYLSLKNLPYLEYVVSRPGTTSLPETRGEVTPFLPYLEQLWLQNLPKLKEWCESSGERMGGDDSISSNEESHLSSLFLSELKFLDIEECIDFTSLLHCPKVERLHLHHFNKRLRIITDPTCCLKLWELKIDDMAWLCSSLPEESFQTLAHLELINNEDVESLTEFGEVLRACSSSLHSFTIQKCPKLRSLLGGLGYLTALETLYLESLPIMTLGDEEIDGEVEGTGVPQGSLCHTLKFLDISSCTQLQSFPNWMQKLVSLQSLRVFNCPKELYKRCENPNGTDWPNIQHIPFIEINLGYHRS